MNVESLLRLKRSMALSVCYDENETLARRLKLSSIKVLRKLSFSKDEDLHTLCINALNYLTPLVHTLTKHLLKLFGSNL